ncbi:uncharacterized protein BJ171DRAFT_599347 [Polychytrium aggregatum]|uniref:uncharacterized protein n=1 Tax=Polychytrium aggregatum TaxID=110093 RepID=UPI0022FE6DE8|nr:uncharacterized protein BJ171DRAFT_599347 [Polychytrium aggregatum]KAI9204163.1 hypothetical protein BJ171DRAFT_599347 [Polychytrium aggregatum]
MESLKPETVKAIFQESTGTEFKISKDALLVSTKLLALFAEEAILQSIECAKETPAIPARRSLDGRLSGSADHGEPSRRVTVTAEHLSKVVPQLLLDFS